MRKKRACERKEHAKEEKDRARVVPARVECSLMPEQQSMRPRSADSVAVRGEQAARP